MKRWALVVVLGTVACGGGSSGDVTAPPTPAPQARTETFTGAANPSCQGGGHSFDTAEGDITLTLVETTGGVGLYGQVCAGGIDSNCTIAQTRMEVGQTLSGARRGIANQNVKMLTLNCGSGPTPPAPVNYTIRLTYLR
jgi:hypothetical protein